MKLKSAIKGLYDTVRSPALRADVVAFLRKYSNDRRLVTHYACRGEQTKTVVAFLKSLGFKADEDFRVLSSAFDPESNSIRFVSGTKISELIRDLSTPGYGRTLDTMYATVANPDVDAICACFVDSEETSVTVPDPVPDHFVMRMLLRSDKILDQLAQIETFESIAPNSKPCILKAAEWAKRWKDQPARPYLLPLPVLEAYYRMFKTTASDKPLVFYASDHMAQETRLAREDERVPLAAFAQAPIPEISEGVPNPVLGYFCDTVTELESADLSNKVGVFAVCDAPMVFHGEGFDDLLTPAKMAVGRWDLWNYVQEIYSACYGLETGFVANGMRIAVADESQIWPSDGAGYPAGRTVLHNAERGNKTEEIMLAKYAILLTDLEVSGLYGDLSNFVTSPSSAPKVIVADETGAPDFTDRSLSKDETAWEWFLMTHDGHRVGTPHRAWYSQPKPATDSEQAARNFEQYRAWKRAANIAKLSHPVTNDDFKYQLGTLGERKWNPISALVDGSIPLAIRLTAGADDVPFKDWGGKNPELHGPNDIVAAVYSGVWTDLSPAVGEDNPDGVFPSMLEFSGFGNEIPAGRREALTKWLDDGVNSSDCQVRFAQRTKGTPRYASVVVETNVNAGEFFRLADKACGGGLGSAEFRNRLAVAFASSMLLRNNDPYVCTDEARRNGMPRKIAYHENMVRDCGPWYPAAFQNQSLYAQGLPGEAADYVSVWTAEDSYGRLVIGFTVSGDALTYARIAYRWLNEMPLATAHVRSKTYSPDPRAVVIPKGSAGKFSSVVAYMRKAMTRSALDDYHGVSMAVSAGGAIGPLHRGTFGEVAPGTAPEREWFTRFGTVSVSDMIA